LDILNLFYYLRFSFVPSQKNSIFVEIMIEYKYTVIKYLKWYYETGIDPVMVFFLLLLSV